MDGMPQNFEGGLIPPLNNNSLAGNIPQNVDWLDALACIRHITESHLKTFAFSLGKLDLFVQVSCHFLIFEISALIVLSPREILSHLCNVSVHQVGMVLSLDCDVVHGTKHVGSAQTRRSRSPTSTFSRFSLGTLECNGCCRCCGQGRSDVHLTGSTHLDSVLE